MGKSGIKVYSSMGIEKPVPYQNDNSMGYGTDESVISWYQNSRNLFPDELLVHYLKASLFAPILQELTSFFTGAGFTTENKELLPLIGSANEKESLRTVFKHLQFNSNLTGNAFLMFAFDDSGKWIKFWNQHSINCRISKDGKRVVIKSSWKNDINSQDAKGEKIALYPKVTKKKNVYYSMIHIKEDVMGFPNYAPPYWIAGLDNSKIPYKTTEWNSTRITNGFSASGFYINPNASDDPKEAQKAINKLNEDYSGGKNAGKIMMIDGEGKMDILDKLFDMDWTKFYTQSKYLMHKDMRFPASLMGDYGEKGFSKDKGLTDYNLFKPFMMDSQELILEPIKKIITEITSQNTDDLQVNNINPFADDAIAVDIQVKKETVIKEEETTEE